MEGLASRWRRWSSVRHGEAEIGCSLFSGGPWLGVDRAGGSKARVSHETDEGIHGLGLECGGRFPLV